MSFPAILKKLGVQRGASGQRSSEPPMPIVVGVGRSGTTLLRLMLDAHPEIAIPPETHFLYRLSKLRSKGESLRQDFLDVVLNSHEWDDFRIPEEVLRQQLASLEPFRTDDGARLFYRLYAERFGKRRWGDKTPGYVLRMTAIQKMLPEARFIHIVRDGRAVAASRRKLFFGPGDDMAAEAADWVNKISCAREQAGKLPHYLEIRYESIVSAPEPVLKEICAFLEIPYSAQMLSYHDTSSVRMDELSDRRNPDGTVKVAKADRLAIHRNTLFRPDEGLIDRWRTELSRDEVEQYNSVAGDLLSELGYDV